MTSRPFGGMQLPPRPPPPSSQARRGSNSSAAVDDDGGVDSALEQLMLAELAGSPLHNSRPTASSSSSSHFARGAAGAQPQQPDASAAAAAALLTIENAEMVFETIRHLKAVGKRKATAAAEVESNLRRALLWAKSSEWIAEHTADLRYAELELSQMHAAAHAAIASASLRIAQRTKDRLRLVVEEATRVSTAAEEKRTEEQTRTAASHSALVERLERDLASTTRELGALQEYSTKTIAAKNHALASLTEQLAERDMHLADLQQRHLALVRRFAGATGRPAAAVESSELYGAGGGGDAAAAVAAAQDWDTVSVDTNRGEGRASRGSIDAARPAAAVPQPTPLHSTPSRVARCNRSTSGAAAKRSQSLSSVVASLPPELLRLLNSELHGADS